MRNPRLLSSRPRETLRAVADEHRWIISSIRKDHIRDPFESGVPALDEFLRRYARQNQDKGLGRTYVATRETSPQVLGYFTIRSGSVAFDDLPPTEQRKLPQYPIPVVHIGRLAVDRRAQGRGLGKILLVEALQKAVEVSQTLAVYAVEVVAKNEQAHGFYLKYGLKSLVDDRLHMYISMKTVRKLFRK